MCWVWDEEGIEAMNITDNVVDYFSDIITNQLSEASMRVLKVAACLGSNFRRSSLRLAVTADIDKDKDYDFDEDYDLIDTLEIAVEEGMVVELNGGTEYKFTHKKLKDAVYSLIPLEVRECFHLEIGRKISGDFMRDERMLFIAADQLNLGAALIVDPSDKAALVDLNLQAASRATESSEFLSTAKYLNAGIKLFSTGHWKDEYDLSLRMFNDLAEAEYHTGNLDLMHSHIQEVFKNAISFSDKLHVHSVHIKALVKQHNISEAIDQGFTMLGQLGVRFPKKFYQPTVTAGVLMIEAKLRRMSDDMIRSLPTMTDKSMLAAMEILDSIVMHVLVQKPIFFALVVSHMIQLSLRHGLCRHSAIGLSLYAQMQCTCSRNLKTGYRFGQLSLQLLERFHHPKETSCRVFLTIFSSVNHWSENLDQSLHPLWTAHRIGLQVKDVEFANLSAREYLQCCFHCGMPLELLEKNIRTICETNKSQNRDIEIQSILPLWQTVLNLIGRSKNQILLKGEAMDQEQILSTTLRHEPNMKFLIYQNVMILAYLFGDSQLAAEMANAAKQKMDFHTKSKHEVSVNAYFEGLVSVILAKETKKRKYRGLAKKSLKEIKKWARHSPQNCTHKVLLLEAEILALDGTATDVIRAYDSAIASAVNHRFVQDEAISYERAALYCIGSGKISLASHYCSCAHQIYHEWGAIAKADHFQNIFPGLVRNGKRLSSFKSFLSERKNRTRHYWKSISTVI